MTCDSSRHTLNRRDDAAQSTVEALMYGLRSGTGKLTKSDTQRRLSQLSEAQLREVCARLQNFKPNIASAWSPDEVAALAKIWSKIHHG